MIFTKLRPSQTSAFSTLREPPLPAHVTGSVSSFQPIASPMQGWAQIANAAVNNMTQANKIKLGSLFGIAPKGLY